MSIFEKNKVEVSEQKDKKKSGAVQLLENDRLILEMLETLTQKLDGMDKNNKKFLMAATMNDGRTEQLEHDIVDMKMGIIGLLDQIDVLLTAILSSESEDLKKGLNSYYRKVQEIACGLGLEVINVTENMKFNSKEMESAEEVQLEDYEDDTVVALLQRGYRDISSGNVLRYAKVSVNKR